MVYNTGSHGAPLGQGFGFADLNQHHAGGNHHGGQQAAAAAGAAGAGAGNNHHHHHHQHNGQPFVAEAEWPEARVAELSTALFGRPVNRRLLARFLVCLLNPGGEADGVRS